MTNCCDISNPLIRDGVSQQQRQLAALPPDSVQVDEQDLADFLVFAYRLSQQIIYYKATVQPPGTPPDPTDNEADGNWQSFFESSVPVQLALISKTRPQTVREVYHRQLEIFLGDRTPANLAPVLLTWSRIFDQMDRWFVHLQSYPPFQSILRGLVKSNLRQPLLRLWAFEQSYIAETGQAIIQTTLEQGLNLYQRLNHRFNLNLNLTVPPIADHTPFRGTTFEARTELDQVFQILFQNYRQIIQLAPSYLAPSLQSRNDHPPHLALYLAFWQVLKPARDDLNRITQRHLDFFYREVLRFPEKAIQPDRAHLLFELAKFQPEYLLQGGTAFKAGKDASGVELIYTLDQAIIVHKAQIASLKGLFLASQETDRGKPAHLTGLHASPVANSANGQGSEFPKAQGVKAWLPFGDGTRPEAAIGLAIASNMLLLGEGDRFITLELGVQKSLSEQIQSVTPTLFDALEGDLSQLFQVKLSGAKEWMQASNLVVTQPTTNPGQLTLVLRVTPEKPAVVAYHPGLPSPSLSGVQQPVLLVQINPEERATLKGLSPYHVLRSLEVTTLRLTVEVDGVRQLMVQNDLAVLDATKPFQPFGSQPKVGSNVYIGSREVFQKPLTELEIHFKLERDRPQKVQADGTTSVDWTALYGAYGVDETNQRHTSTGKYPFDPGTLKVQGLRHKEWHPAAPDITLDLFDPQSFFLDSSALTTLNLHQFIEITSLEPFTPQTQNGFLRLQLTGDSFLHEHYATVLTRQVLAAATSELIEIDRNVQRKAVIGAFYRLNNQLIQGGEDGNYYVAPTAEPLIPNEPYTPVMTELSLHYKAEVQYPTQPSDLQLFHLYPLDGYRAIAPSPSFPLMPLFVDEGTLYIGIQDLEPPTALPLLIQVAEETANTDLLKASVQWSYLSNDTWKPFEQHLILHDGTNGLIASGIIQFGIPADISRGKTLLDSNLYWIKAAVTERSGAICQIIGIHTQAAQVTFSNRSNDPAHLAELLPQGAIAKLVEPQPAIKKIEQPYRSFNGQGKEAPTQYYIRVSEHLHHKGRAVTIFDYERLVLEKFPDIYKVRCINHSRVNDSLAMQERDNLQELVPGSVTLAVIPDLSQRTTTNDLQPKVNINLLEEIRQYLMTLSSPWVDIRVVNPRYEEIQVEFQVQFHSPYDQNFGYYQRQLQRAILGLLSPWTVKNGADIHFGGKVYRSSILNFVEEQPYVDYVLNFQMHQGNQRNVRAIAASSARSILVSVPFSEDVNTTTGHIIQPPVACAPNRLLETGQLGYNPLDQLRLEE